MNWFVKIALSDSERIKHNILRLESLKGLIHDLGYYAFASQSGCYKVFTDILKDKLILGRESILKKLNEAYIGENNQKVVIDSPSKFQNIMTEAESLIDIEITKEKSKLRKIENDGDIKRPFDSIRK